MMLVLDRDGREMAQGWSRDGTERWRKEMVPRDGAQVALAVWQSKDKLPTIAVRYRWCKRAGESSCTRKPKPTLILWGQQQGGPGTL